MTSTLTELSVVLRLAAHALWRRLRGQIKPAPHPDDFISGMRRLLDQAPPDLIADSAWLSMPATQPPWLNTNLDLEANQELTYFADGRVYANKLLDIWISPALQLWSRVGGQGEVFRGTRSSHSFRVERSGPLYFGNYFPNDWADSQGSRLQSDDVYSEVTGQISILVVRWTGRAIDGLLALRSRGDYQGRLQTEIDRIRQGDITPHGWQYLWNIGPGEIYRSEFSDKGKACIHCDTRADVGILQHEAGLPLERTTEISWRWRIDELPSSLREDTVPSHDYLSLAVEFDNGKDISYYWSSKLPVDTGYDCPLPNWHGREFHVVVRSGRKGLGEWLNERRNVYDDYCRYIGEPPARVARVWLIANSIFQRKNGKCLYSDIFLRTDSEEVCVL